MSANMGPEPNDPYGPNHKRKQLCEPQYTSADFKKMPNVEPSSDFAVPVYIKGETVTLWAGIQDNQSQISHKNANSMGENSFSTESLETYVKLEGDTEMECEDVFPSTSDTTRGEIGPIYSRTPEDCIEIKDESEVLPHDRVSLGIDIKSENDDDLEEIKTEIPDDSKNVAFLNGEIKVEDVMVKDEYSEPGEPPKPQNGAAVVHGSYGATGNANRIDTSNMVLDPETGLFIPADNNDDMPEELQAPQCAGWGSWNDQYTPDTPTDQDNNQPECSLAVGQPVTASADKSPVNISLDRPTTPENPSKFVSVEMLLNHPFFSGFWTSAEQNEILIQPIPLAKWSRKTVYSPEQIFLLEFEFSRFPWLCESSEIERFFCWSCLLFATSEDTWSIAASACGSCDQDFEEALIDHQSTLEHLNAQTTYDLKKKFTCTSIKEHNLDTCRKLWRRFVKTICLEKRKNSNLEVQNPEFVAEVQEIIKRLFRRSIAPQTVVQYSNKILSFASYYLKINLIDDVKNAQYVVLHLEDLSSVVEDKTWLAVIARYVDQNGVIDEKLVDFVKTFPVRTPRTAGAAIKWMKPIFSDYKLNNKLVGFSYSASIVTPNEIPLFHKLILQMCPRVQFFHSPTEHFYKSLFQAISHVSACRKYFKEVKQLCVFLATNQSLIGSVEKSNGYLTTPLPKTFDAHFIANLRSYYSTVLLIFQRLVSLGTCAPEVEQEGRRLARFLQTPKTRIMIVLVGQMSSTVAGLAAALGRFNLDLVMEERTKSIKTLMYIRSHGFKEMHKMTNDPTLIRGIHDLSPHFVEIVERMMDFAVAFLLNKFENLQQLKYTSCDLLQSTLKHNKYPVKSPEFIKRAGLSQNEVNQLHFLIYSPYSPVFIQDKNHTELLDLLVQQKKTLEYPGLHKYLLFVHLMSFAKSEQKQLLKSIYSFCRNVSPEDLTQEFLNGYFWQLDNDRFEKILEDPELYFKALQVCQLKIVVENEYHVKMVAYSYFP